MSIRVFEETRRRFLSRRFGDLPLRRKYLFSHVEDGTVVLSKVIYDLKNTEYLGILSVGFDREMFSVVFPDAEKAALGILTIVDDKLRKPVVVSPGGRRSWAATILRLVGSRTSTAPSIWSTKSAAETAGGASSPTPPCRTFRTYP